MDAWLNKLIWRWTGLRERWGLGEGAPVLSLLILLLIVVLSLLGGYWGREQPTFAVVRAEGDSSRPGQLMVATAGRLAAVLHEKPGGYLRNDVLPPGVLIDNVPAWEQGVLGQLRDVVAGLQREPSPASRSGERDPDLMEAAAAFATPDDSWVMPSMEGELERGGLALARYQVRLAQGAETNGMMEGEALLRWLPGVNGRLQEMSARLNAALPAYSADPVDLAGVGDASLPETSWWRIDDVFYEARGSAWALLHLLKAAEVDYGPLLARHHADLSLRAAIHELEATQQPLWSPVVLNGSGFGLFANHSLVMANYLHRARADLADVQLLLLDGK